MLVTNPALRAPLHEILAHPWMLRGFQGPPTPHLVRREPLRPQDIDPQVIRGMSGFEFGADGAEISDKLLAILESDAYTRAVRAWERRRGGPLSAALSDAPGAWEPPSNDPASASSLSVSSAGGTPASSRDTKKRRFSGFDFYRRKLFASPSPSPTPPTPTAPAPSTSALSLGLQPEDRDPTRGFHPLVSMYYLAREKMERERVYGTGVFASSQVSVADDPVTSSSATAAAAAREKENVAAAAHAQANGTTAAVKTEKQRERKADYNMPLPRLPIPETSHYSGMSYDADAQPAPNGVQVNGAHVNGTGAASASIAPPTPTASPTAMAFHPQPRARDAGVGVTVVPASPGPAQRTHEREEPPRAGTLAPIRAPPASTHRRSHSLSQRPTVLRGWGGMFGGDRVEEEGPRTAGPEIGGFAERERQREKEREREREKEREKERERERKREEKEEKEHDHGSISLSGGATLVRKFGSMLVGSGRHGEDGTGRRTPSKRATILGGLSPRASRDDGHRDRERSLDEKDSAPPNVTIAAPPPAKSVSHSQSQPFGSVHRRAATVLDPAGRAARHERRSSTGAAMLGVLQSGGTIGRHRRPSTGQANGTRPKADRLFSKTEEEDEAAERLDEEATDGEGEGVRDGNDFRSEDERHTNEKDFKPVFLKGLFRYVFFPS
jgi:hypothetical protein